MPLFKLFSKGARLRSGRALQYYQVAGPRFVDLHPSGNLR